MGRRFPSRRSLGRRHCSRAMQIEINGMLYLIGSSEKRNVWNEPLFCVPSRLGMVLIDRYSMGVGSVAYSADRRCNNGGIQDCQNSSQLSNSRLQIFSLDLLPEVDAISHEPHLKQAQVRVGAADHHVTFITYHSYSRLLSRPVSERP